MITTELIEEKYEQTLFESIMHGDLGVCAALVMAGVVVTKDHLEFALKYERYDILKILLEMGKFASLGPKNLRGRI
ncbi:MAG: hypothetical protein KAS32_11410 [Candidatus Peribacteraceae bacterium]|nr:hypothetical protein [Candidatus Peribacteraceae bacterium]